MIRKKLPSSEGQRSDSFLKRSRTVEHGTVKYSKVVLRFGSKMEEYEFSLPLLTLAIHSVKIRRYIESSFDEDGRPSGAIVIDMPSFKCDIDILRMVEDILVRDICCGVMEETLISTSNVVRLFKAADFLEMEIVKCKAMAYLEKNAFISWENCLDVLATFDGNDLPGVHAASAQWNERRGRGEIALFERCRRAFLVKIPVNLTRWSDDLTNSCNVMCLLQVAQLLPPNAAKHIFESCWIERFGLCLNWRNRPTSIRISCHLKQNSIGTGELRCETNFYWTDIKFSDPSSEVSWIEGLPNLLPDLSRRSLFVLHLAKMMRVGSGATAGIRWSSLSWGFLCGLLVEASRLSRTAEEFKNSLHVEIDFLEKLVIQGLEHPKLSKYIAELLELVMKFTFGTLLSIVRHFRNIVSDDNIDHVAKLIDNCILENLKRSSFTTQQALMIYKEFPNYARKCHVELYQTMRTAALSAEEAVELSKRLDYNKLPDDIIEKLFGELEFGWNPRLVKRFLDIQEVKRIEKEMWGRELLRLRSDLSAQNAELMKVMLEKEREERTLEDEVKIVVKIQKAHEEELVQLQSERDALLKAEKLFERERNEFQKSMQSAEIQQDSLRQARDLAETMTKTLEEGKKLAESQRDAAQHGLAEEKEKTTCRICFKNPRDALSLPCMHFLYCTKCLDNHHQKLKTCPACQTFTHEVLKCNLAI